MPPVRYAYDPYADEYAAQLDPNYVAPAPPAAVPMTDASSSNQGTYTAPPPADPAYQYGDPGDYGAPTQAPVAGPSAYQPQAGGVVYDNSAPADTSYQTPANGYAINQGAAPAPQQASGADTLLNGGGHGFGSVPAGFQHGSLGTGGGAAGGMMGSYPEGDPGHYSMTPTPEPTPKPQGELKPQDTYLGGINPVVPRSNAWNPIVPEQRNNAGIDNIQTQPTLQERHNTRGTDAFGQTGTDGTSDPHYVPPAPATDPLGGNDTITGYNSGYGTPTGVGYGISDPSLGGVAPWSPDIASTFSGSDAAIDSTLSGVGTTLGGGMHSLMQDAARGALGNGRAVPEYHTGDLTPPGQVDTNGSPNIGGILHGLTGNPADALLPYMQDAARRAMGDGSVNKNDRGAPLWKDDTMPGAADALAQVLGSELDPSADPTTGGLRVDVKTYPDRVQGWHHTFDAFGALGDPNRSENQTVNGPIATALDNAQDAIAKTENNSGYNLLDPATTVKLADTATSPTISGVTDAVQTAATGGINSAGTMLADQGKKVKNTQILQDAQGAAHEIQGRLAGRALADQAGSLKVPAVDVPPALQSLLSGLPSNISPPPPPSFSPTSADQAKGALLTGLDDIRTFNPNDAARGVQSATQGIQSIAQQVDPEGLGQALLALLPQGTGSTLQGAGDTLQSTATGINDARQSTKPGFLQNILDAGTAKAQQGQNVVTDKVQSTLGQQPQTDALRRAASARQAALTAPPQPTNQRAPFTPQGAPTTVQPGISYPGDKIHLMQQQGDADATGNLTGGFLDKLKGNGKAADGSPLPILVDSAGHWTQLAADTGRIAPEHVGEAANIMHMPSLTGKASTSNGVREATNADLAGGGVVAPAADSSGSKPYVPYSKDYNSGYTHRSSGGGGGGGGYSSGGGGGRSYGHPQPDLDQARSVLGPDFMKGFMDDFAFGDMFGPGFPFGDSGSPAGGHSSTHKTRKTKRSRTGKTRRGSTSHAPTKKPTSVGFPGSKKP